MKNAVLILSAIIAACLLSFAIFALFYALGIGFLLASLFSISLGVTLVWLNKKDSWLFWLGIGMSVTVSTMAFQHLFYGRIINVL